MSEAEPMAYVTLGDIADEMRRMREQGMTAAVVAYAFAQVYGEDLRAAAREQ